MAEWEPKFSPELFVENHEIPERHEREKSTAQRGRAPLMRAALRLMLFRSYPSTSHVHRTRLPWYRRRADCRSSTGMGLPPFLKAKMKSGTRWSKASHCSSFADPDGVTRSFKWRPRTSPGWRPSRADTRWFNWTISPLSCKRTPSARASICWRTWFSNHRTSHGGSVGERRPAEVAG